MAFGIFDGHCDTLTTLQEDERLYDAPRSIGKLHSGIGIHHAECSIHLAGSCKVS